MNLVKAEIGREQGTRPSRRLRRTGRASPQWSMAWVQSR